MCDTVMYDPRLQLRHLRRSIENSLNTFKYQIHRTEAIFCCCVNAVQVSKITTEETNYCMTLNKQANKPPFQLPSFNCTVMQMLLSCIVSSPRHCMDDHSTHADPIENQPTHTDVKRNTFPKYCGRRCTCCSHGSLAYIQDSCPRTGSLRMPVYCLQEPPRLADGTKSCHPKK